MRSKIVLASSISLFFMGCSALMPYHEDFKCQGGSEVNICKRVSDVYLESDKLNLPDKNTTSTVENDNTKELKEMIEAISYNELKNPVEVVIINKCNDLISKKESLKKRLHELFKKAKLFIEIDKNKILANKEKFNLEKFEEKIKTKYGNLDKNSLILIEFVNRNIDYDAFKKIYSLLKDLGFKRIGLILNDEVVWLKNKEDKKTISKRILNKKVRVCVLNANIRKEPSCLSKIIRIAHKNEILFAYYEENGWVKIKDGYIHKSLICGECKEVK